MKEQKLIRCNGCGKTIAIEDDMYREGVLLVRQEWGYFSEKDGERHSFCLCEACYDKIIQNFAIPVEIEEYL
ncbi:MAG: hypothetical protein LUI39_07820 [Lachnospiraceae bacterium]|nr:hypothetical protein [Lachnospiraceae bacterium]